MTDVADMLGLDTIADLFTAAAEVGERDAALMRARAERLALEAAVAALLLADLPGFEDPITTAAVEFEGRFAAVRRSILAGVARSMGCEVLLRRPGKAFVIELHGYSSDLARAQVLGSAHTEKALADLAASTPHPGYSKATWGRSFLSSYAQHLEWRLTADAHAVLDRACTDSEVADLSEARETAFAAYWTETARRLCVVLARKPRLSGCATAEGAEAVAR